MPNLIEKFLFITLLSFASLKLDASSDLINILNQKVSQTLKHSEEVPGLKAEEFGALKTEIAEAWDKLVHQAVLEVEGTDKDVRPCFVALQALVEHVLSRELCHGVTSLKGMIHTPMPATPLCSNGEISEDLVDPSIEQDAKRLFTVKARTTIVRDFLYQGGYLYIIYPKDGLAKRTEAQQSIYHQELMNYPEHLIDQPLNISSIPDELIGATYFFTDCGGNTYVFAINMTQAKDPRELGKFGLWFGSLENPAVYKRVEAVMSFIDQSFYN